MQYAETYDMIRYMNYEYMMLEISKQYSLNYIKVDNLLWHEIDNIEHYHYVVEKLLRRIYKKEQSMHLQNLKKIVSKCMDIPINNIQEIFPIGGMTNNNYKFRVNNKEFVLRIPGNGTEGMISRQEEVRNAIYANKIGVDAELVYFNEDTGIKISRFIENAETLSPESAKKQSSMIMVTNVLKRLHNSKLEMDNNFDIYDKIEKYESEGWLHYHGYQKDVRPFIEACHCFVLPSWHEGMANTNLESAATGRPIITSNIHGCKEAVVDGKTGFLANRKDAEDLYKVMKKMTQLSYEERQVMGLAGREHMEKVFDKKKVVGETISCLLKQ